MTDLEIGLVAQLHSVEKELNAIRKHIFFKLESAHSEDRALLLEYENKILSALHSLD